MGVHRNCLEKWMTLEIKVILDIVRAEAKGKEMKADGSVCRKV